MTKAMIILLGAILLAILGYFCIYHHSSSIQDDIQTRALKSIAENGLDSVTVNTDGRDVLLTGEVKNEKIKSKAEKLVWGIYGVRTVDNQLVVAVSESEPEPEPVEIILLPDAVEKPEAVQAPKFDALPEYSCQQDFDLLLSSNEIIFVTNNAEIDASSNSLLNDLVNVAKQCPDTNIEIGAHTDSRGSNDHSLRLSQARAASVMAYLVNKGINAYRLIAAGYAKTAPIADDDTDEGLAKNRRIEFNVKGL